MAILQDYASRSALIFRHPLAEVDMQSITVRTFREALQAGYRLRADCHRCSRGIEIDLAAMVLTAQADKTFIARQWRCTVCGQLGGLTVWPPSTPPVRSGAHPRP